MENRYLDVVNRQREKDRPGALIDAARFLSDYQFRASQSTATAQDSGGYYNGGTYTNFFTLGVSTFGSTDELS